MNIALKPPPRIPFADDLEFMVFRLPNGTHKVIGVNYQVVEGTRLLSGFPRELPKRRVKRVSATKIASERDPKTVEVWF